MLLILRKIVSYIIILTVTISHVPIYPKEGEQPRPDIITEETTHQLSLELPEQAFYPVNSIKTKPVVIKNYFITDNTMYSIQLAAPDPMLWLNQTKKIELMDINGLYLVEFQEIRYHYSSERVHFEYHIKPYQQSIFFSLYYYLY
ncbi:hypothetical protein DA717_14805 [Piscirickettsiaceae bacterium NZ-RLO2]|nr:hypothetical protein DA717_14805 [Piscirickettsiaceae bacterium NZ-RLO2]